jgi:hypothetical protein
LILESGVEVVAMTGPRVDQPPIAPVKVGEAVT